MGTDLQLIERKSAVTCVKDESGSTRASHEFEWKSFNDGHECHCWNCTSLRGEVLDSLCGSAPGRFGSGAGACSDSAGGGGGRVGWYCVQERQEGVNCARLKRSCLPVGALVLCI